MGSPRTDPDRRDPAIWLLRRDSRSGLGFRYDWGPHYTTNQLLGQLRWLGIRSAPAYVKEAECNRGMKQWLRMLIERYLYRDDYEHLDETRRDIGVVVKTYNRECLIKRHGPQTPIEAHQHLSDQAA